jgi:hypothetical protein
MFVLPLFGRSALPLFCLVAFVPSVIRLVHIYIYIYIYVEGSDLAVVFVFVWALCWPMHSDIWDPNYFIALGLRRIKEVPGGPGAWRAAAARARGSHFRA